MRIQLRILFILLYSFINIIGFGQNYILKNYSSLNGLPSNEVHDLYEDANGYIWLATDHGIARYDGVRFSVYKINQKARSSVVFNFFESDSTKVWVNTIENKMYWFNPIDQNIDFHPFNHNDSLYRGIQNSLGLQYIRKAWLDKSNRWNFSFLINAGRVIIDQEGKIIYDCVTKSDMKNGRYQGHLYQDLVVHIEKSSSSKALYTNYEYDSISPLDIIIYDHELDRRVLFDLKYDSDVRFQHSVSDFEVYKEGVIFVFGNNLIQYEDGDFSYTKLNVEGLKLAIIEDEIFVATYSGIEVFDNKLNRLQTFLEDRRITSVIEDRKKGIWLSTIENGVYYISNKDIVEHKHPTRENCVYSELQIDSNYVYGISWHNTLCIIDHDGDLLKEFPKSHGHNDYFMSSNRTDFSPYLKDRIPVQYSKGSSNQIMYYAPSYDRTKMFVDGKKNRISIVELGSNSLVKRYFNKAEINSIGIIRDKQALFATNSGLYIVNDVLNPEESVADHILKDCVIKQIEPYRNAYLLSTIANGLIYYSEDTTYQLNTDNGLSSNNIADFTIENNQSIWVGSINGVDHIEVDSNLSKIKISHVNMNNGLLNNDISCLTHYNDTIWVSTRAGLCSFPSSVDKLDPLLDPELFYLDSVIIGRAKIDYTDKIEVDFGKRINIYFNQIAYSVEDNIQYRYKISNLYPEWENVSGRKLSLINLPAGKYELLVQSYIPNFENGPVIHVSIKVRTPWYFSWWAIALYILVILGGFYLLFIFLSRRFRRKKEEELRKVQLELKALIAQMNPHFTFNTINSIQHFIMQNNKKEALNFLAKFASLIRKSLEYSRAEFITLQDEISFLKNYAELENKRFDFDFKFQVNIQDDIDISKVAFPALLLQPIVENAIIHGISSLKKEGNITINIDSNDSYYIISIQDNGIGIDQKSKNKRHNRESFGIEILKQRLKLYNGDSFKENHIQVLSNTSGVKGTLVKIYLKKDFSLNDKKIYQI